jgi:hypothetical protein
MRLLLLTFIISKQYNTADDIWPDLLTQLITQATYPIIISRVVIKSASLENAVKCREMFCYFKAEFC